ncbi:Uncharacterized protein FWK35_00028015 [Aphis craccivora]|uniref:Uncharacterized protein n=1 Tax=Aphis craccivora TaxID=307492 RepID=A0A6G0WIU7_APHCR|nr:Uncharacterized protein FWK35_00028015 [Aphis craccivora]
MFGVNDNITKPTGTYTLKCKIACSHEIDLSIENSIATLLGFRNVVYTTDSTHESENTVNIMNINCIKIECNLITDSFCDGSPSKTIHEFYPTVAVGYKIVEVPRHLFFIKVEIILKDHKDRLINLRGEPITIQLQITHR